MGLSSGGAVGAGERGLDRRLDGARRKEWGLRGRREGRESIKIKAKVKVKLYQLNQSKATSSMPSSPTTDIWIGLKALVSDPKSMSFRSIRRHLILL